MKERTLKATATPIPTFAPTGSAWIPLDASADVIAGDGMLVDVGSLLIMAPVELSGSPVAVNALLGGVGVELASSP